MSTQFIVIIFVASLVVVSLQAQVQSYTKIAEGMSGFVGDLDESDSWSGSMSAIGDLDDDGIVDLVVGAWADDDGGEDRGAVWILFMNVDGTVKSHQKISDTEGGFAGDLDNVDRFGTGTMPIGDFDGDGVEDLVVGASRDDDGGEDRGAIWLLFLNTDGTVKSHQKISDTAGGFGGTLDDGDRFGSGQCVAYLGDLDGDSVPDLSVGARYDDDGGVDRGAVYVLFMNSDGTVKSHQKISSTEGGFNGDLDDSDLLGVGGASLGDVSGDGVTDIAYGALRDDDGFTDSGAIWIMFLNSDGTVNGHQKISNTTGGLNGTWDFEEFVGRSVEELGDVDGNGIGDLALGIWGDNDGGTDRGSVWILFLDEGGTVNSELKISDTVGGFDGDLDDEDRFGASVANMGDIDNDGLTELAVGAPLDDDGEMDQGAIYILNTDMAYQYSGVVVDVSIDSAFQIVPVSGDTFTYSLTLVNNSDESQTVDVWMSVERPQGDDIDVLFGPETITMEPAEEVTYDNNLMPVPFDAPAGYYTLIASVGTFPEPVSFVDSTHFYKEYDLNLDLEGVYLFNGSPSDESGNENHGELLGGASSAGYLLIGDNDVDRLGLPESMVDGLADFSFSGWVRIDELHVDGTLPANVLVSSAIASEDNMLVIFYRAGEDAWGMRLNGSAEYFFDENNVIEDGDWHYVTVSRRGGLARLHIDGQQVGTDLPVSPALVYADEDGFFIGQEQDCLGGCFVDRQSLAGAVDDLRMYHRSLSDLEIQALMSIPQTSGVLLSLESVPSSIPEEGALFEFDLEIYNGQPEELLTTVWVKMVSPDGSTIDPLFGPDGIYAEPLDSFSVSYELEIPATYAPGEYQLVAYAGTMNDDTLTTTSASFVKDVAGNVDSDASIPTRFDLKQNHPNPFNPSTTIEIVLPLRSEVRLSIYNIVGEQIAVMVNRNLAAGLHRYSWDGRNASGQLVASGAYFYQLVAIPASSHNEFGNFGDAFIASRKMILIR